MEERAWDGQMDELPRGITETSRTADAVVERPAGFVEFLHQPRRSRGAWGKQQALTLAGSNRLTPDPPTAPNRAGRRGRDRAGRMQGEGAAWLLERLLPPVGQRGGTGTGAAGGARTILLSLGRSPAQEEIVSYKKKRRKHAGEPT